MNNQIKKINLNHSFIFFFLSNILSIIIFKYSNLNISSLFCLVLILIFGISHGALDHIKGDRLLKIFGIKQSYIFYLVYVIFSLLIIYLWLALPTLILIIFLVIASYHFGKEDTQFLINDKSYATRSLYFLKGLLIVLAPIYFHFDETVAIFKLLFVENENFYSSLNFVEKYNVIQIGIVLSIFASVFLFFKEFEIRKFSIFLDFCSIIILNYYLSPLVAFTIYFCFLHSIRHTISLAVEINENNLYEGLIIFIKKALPLTFLTAFLGVISLYLLNIIYNLDSAILKIIFIGLASLTFPHILLEYFLEKNEK